MFILLTVAIALAFVLLVSMDMPQSQTRKGRTNLTKPKYELNDTPKKTKRQREMDNILAALESL